MRDLFLAEFNNKSSESELLWLIITAILRVCSGAGTAQWQYVCPTRASPAYRNHLFFQVKASEILQDVEYAQRNGWSARSSVLLAIPRAPQDCAQVQVDAVVTSPPYPNNYDYADATRLEMTFWGELTDGETFKTLFASISSGHAPSTQRQTGSCWMTFLLKPYLDPIRRDVSTACRTLAEVRETKGGRRTITLWQQRTSATSALCSSRCVRFVGPEESPVCYR